MKKTKKTLTMILCMMCALTLAMPPCYATSLPNNMPRWNNVSDVNTSLDFYDNLGVATSSIGKGSTATSLTGVLTVYEYYASEWNNVYCTSKTTTRNTLFLSVEFDGISGREYKAELVVTAYNGTTVIEEITDVKYASCP